MLRIKHDLGLVSTLVNYFSPIVLCHFYAHGINNIGTCTCTQQALDAITSELGVLFLTRRQTCSKLVAFLQNFTLL